MPLFLAVFCGRWGCTWWEGIITLFIMSLPAIPVLLFLLLLGLLKAVLFITKFARPKPEIKPTYKPEKQNKSVLIATNILGSVVQKQLDNRRNKHES